MRQVTLSNNFHQIDFAKLSRKAKDPMHLRRLLALHHLQLGYKVTQTAKNLSVSSRMIHRWINQFEEFGLGGLKDKTGRGRKKALTESEMEKLKDILFQRKNVKANTLKDILIERFDTKVTLPTCYRILKELQIKTAS